MDGFIPELALTTVGGGIGSALTMLVGWKQFREQRWWDKKQEAYVAIIDAFHPLLDEFEAYFDAELGLKGTLPEDKRSELRKMATIGRDRINRQCRLASFLISEDARTELRLMARRLDEAEFMTDWVQYRETTWNALIEALDAVKAMAVDDLGVSQTSTWHNMKVSDLLLALAS